jgi:hypothetical protein
LTGFLWGVPVLIRGVLRKLFARQKPPWLRRLPQSVPGVVALEAASIG